MYRNSCIPPNGPKLIETLKSEMLSYFQSKRVSYHQHINMKWDLSRSSDDKIHKATVCYQNSTKAVDRFTNHAVRELIMIHPVDELNMMEELGQIATFADIQYKLTTWPKNIFGPYIRKVQVPFFVQVQHKNFCS